jgi:hypothetical protein
VRGASEDWQWLRILSRHSNSEALDEMQAAIDEHITLQERPELDEFFRRDIC